MTSVYDEPVGTIAEVFGKWYVVLPGRRISGGFRSRDALLAFCRDSEPVRSALVAALRDLGEDEMVTEGMVRALDWRPATDEREILSRFFGVDVPFPGGSPLSSRNSSDETLVLVWSGEFYVELAMHGCHTWGDEVEDVLDATGSFLDCWGGPHGDLHGWRMHLDMLLRWRVEQLEADQRAGEGLSSEPDIVRACCEQLQAMFLAEFGALPGTGDSADIVALLERG